ncbi:MFS transporter [Roseateles sp.]|uniref:MFS transporter n=1 Tax=Roseateles sp. TaxID=1971397 RepID=UPI002E0BE5BD|nr:MFS transporter [Roseateles sp.]HEV6968912.1 MFS transporter [Roseateles sp.]
MAAAALHAPPQALGWRGGLAYGSLAAPLAFVSLPLYVNLPYHYATVLGLPLPALGAVMLGVRALDAFIDPALGRLADRLLRRGTGPAWRAMAVGSALLALAFAALWQPPWREAARATAWLAATLLACTLAYSTVGILHQSWGTRWGGGPALRARVAGWREGGTLAGVLLAAVLPAWLGWPATSLALAVLLALGLAGLYRLQAPVLTPVPAAAAEPTGGPSAWRQPAFRRLLAVFMLNGIANAVPATLLPFFIADRLEAPAWQAPLLLAYFGAAVIGLPAWVRAAGRWGVAPTWRAGMLASVLAFAATPWLAAGDGPAFAIVCLSSGLALGADLALPGALLTGVIHRGGAGGRDEGAYLGWWTCATKLNLALAAGLALPLLAAAGYRSGTSDAAGLQALAWAYGGLPCLLKLAAAAALWRAERRHPDWKDRE